MTLPRHMREAADAARSGNRYSNMPDNPTSDVIGPPSEFLDEMAKHCWEWCRLEWWWLTEADRPLMEIFCTLRGRLMVGEPLEPRMLSHYLTILKAVGGTPSDRKRVDLPSTGDDDGKKQAEAGNRFLD